MSIEELDFKARQILQKLCPVILLGKTEPVRPTIKELAEKAKANLTDKEREVLKARFGVE